MNAEEEENTNTMSGSEENEQELDQSEDHGSNGSNGSNDEESENNSSNKDNSDDETEDEQETRDYYRYSYSIKKDLSAEERDKMKLLETLLKATYEDKDDEDPPSTPPTERSRNADDTSSKSNLVEEDIQARNEQILEILESCPKLAKMNFLLSINDASSDSFRPLHAILRTNPELEIVKKVYNLYPRAAGKKGRTCAFQNPLALTFEHHTNNAVREFFLNKCPWLASATERCPLVPAVRCKDLQEHADAATIAIFQKLMELGPTDFFDDFSPIRIAIHCKLHIEVVRMIAQKTVFKEPYDKPHFGFFGISDTERHIGLDLTDCLDEEAVIGLYQAKCIEQVLPFVESITLEPDGWTDEGMKYTIQILNAFKGSLTKVSLQIPKKFYETENLLQFIEGESSAVREFTFTAKSECASDSFISDVLLPSLKTEKQNMSVLILENVKFSDSKCFMEFLLASNLPVIYLHHCEVSDPLIDNAEYPLDYTKSRTHRLRLKCCEIHDSVWGQIARIPTLSTVLCHGDVHAPASAKSKVNMSFIIPLLENNRVRELTLWDLSFNNDDIDPMMAALKANTSLKDLSNLHNRHVSGIGRLEQGVLSVLKGGNTTLQHYSTTTYADEYPAECYENKAVVREIQYYTYLNELGRGKLRDPATASVPCLIECLSGVERFVEGEYDEEEEDGEEEEEEEEEEDSVDSIEKTDKNNRLILTYGLLREVPGLLTSTVDAFRDTNAGITRDGENTHHISKKPRHH